MNHIKKKVLGESWLKRQQRKLWLKTLHRRIVCWVIGHPWGEKSPVITDGPIGVHPREREYHMLGFHIQCGRCYDVRDVPYTKEEEANAIREAMLDDEEEWPEMVKAGLVQE